MPYVVSFALFLGLTFGEFTAAVACGLLLVCQKKLRGIIPAHAVTNLGLGIYVVTIGNRASWQEVFVA